MKSISSLLLSLSLLLNACSPDDTRARALQSEIDGLTQKQFESQQSAKRLQSQIEASRAERAKLEGERDKVSKERDAAKQEVEQLKKEFDNYKSLYKVSIRKRAPGMKLDDFAIDGIVFHNIQLRELTESGVNFTHDSGVKKANLKELPLHLQAVLGFTPDEPSRAIVATKPLNPREIAIQGKLLLAQAEDDEKRIRDQLNEAKSRITRASGEMRTLMQRGLPINPTKAYLEQLDISIRRMEGQLSEAVIRHYEVKTEVNRLTR